MGVLDHLDLPVLGADASPRDGDVYSFFYSEASLERARCGIGHGDLRWCFDGQLIYRDGLLCDTYWGLNWKGTDGRRFTWADAHAAGRLTFICNLQDVEKISEHEFPLYAQGDAFNLSYQHGCYKHFVKRTGARKSQALMTAALHAKVSDAQQAVGRAVRHLESAVEQRERLLPHIEAGEEPSF